MTDVTATKLGLDTNRIRDNEVHARMQNFIERWAVALDLNKRGQAEFTADLTLLMQAIHRDAQRENVATIERILSLAAARPVFVPADLVPHPTVKS